MRSKDRQCSLAQLAVALGSDPRGSRFESLASSVMTNYENRVVNRLVQFDERSRNFRAVAEGDDRPVRSYTWSCDVYNDQGSEGACVGYAWSHELSARPVVYKVGPDFAQAVYYRARQIDPWPGEDYEGTSVLAGIKAVMETLNERGLPLYGGYEWAFGLRETVLTIAYTGPVIFGVNWYYSMYRPDANGFIRPGGSLAGGHAIMGKAVKVVRKDGTTGYPVVWENVDLDKSYVTLHNSWGTGYGLGGDARITFRDLDTLLKEQGEVCVPRFRRK